MQGRIIKGVGGLYEVYTAEGIFSCKAKGIFRKNHIKPLVGDKVCIELLKDEENCGQINEILPRFEELIRPNVANVDQALIIFALKDPEPNYVTLDKMILQYKSQGLPVSICFNKDDLADDTAAIRVAQDYRDCGHEVFITSAKNMVGIEEVKAALTGKTTTVAGPSGVGKSSMINCLCKESVAQTGDISQKLLRGKHTTRHSEIIPIDDNTFIIDTPGFSSFDLFNIKAEEIGDYYNEFEPYNKCRFAPCSHTHEPGCGVKEAVEKGLVSNRRYENYVHIFKEVTNLRRY